MPEASIELVVRWIPKSLRLDGCRTKSAGSTDSEVIRLFLFGDVFVFTTSGLVAPEAAAAATLATSIRLGDGEAGDVVEVTPELPEISESNDPEEFSGTAATRATEEILS